MSLRRLITMITGPATAVVLTAGLVHAGAAPAAAVTACERQADGMPAPWRSSRERSWAAPGNRYAAAPMYVPPYPEAVAAADRAESAGNSATAHRLRRIAAQPRAVWFTDAGMPPADLTARVADVVAAARRAGRVATLVMYAIPLRDCGGYSAGGAPSGSAYVDWAKAFRAGLRQGGVGQGPGVSVIIEPDALAQLGDLPADRQTERLELVREVVNLVAQVPRTSAYIDAGNRGWVTPAVMINRLSRAGIAMARGFSLNVSNFDALSNEISYGNQMVGRLGWKHFVIDTGRNGAGSGDSVCNPPGRALGRVPQSPPQDHVDAYLWVKPPGESDGACGAGDPPAGQFDASYADELAVNAGW